METKSDWYIENKSPLCIIGRLLDFNNPNFLERRSSMMAHAVLLMGESQVGKSSIIARLLRSSPIFPPSTPIHNH
jgi:GTP-binding protein EngB required for normal cell division